MKKSWFLLLFIFISVFSFAQIQDSSSIHQTHILPEFSVSEKLDQIFMRVNTQEIDSQTIQSHHTDNLAILLSRNSAVTIKSYGVTGLSSISMRGGNSNHTAVLWNGFNIQDPLNGGYNFSTTTTNVVDEISVQYGGGSFAYGSGAIGGSVHLNNTPTFNNHFFGNASYRIGSYGLRSFITEIGHGNNKLSTKLKLFSSSSKNNFEFQNIGKIGNPVEKYINAERETYGVLHELYFKIKKDQLISSQLWFQYNYRDIPSSITDPNEDKEENQTDKWMRWALNWNKYGDKIDYEVRTGIFYNTSNYINSTIDLNSIHSSIRNTSEGMATINFLKKQKITFGINNNYVVGISENFNNTPSLNTAAFYSSTHLTLFKKITLNIGLRNEIFRNEIKPLTYSFNIRYNIIKKIYLTANFSKNHRTPTFNDLFWIGGSASGNPNLKDEHGHSRDIGFSVKQFNNKINIKYSASFYQNTINNLIQWIPKGQNWTPENAKLVKTQGVEFMLASDYKIAKELLIRFNLTYTYTDAQLKEKSINESDDILNKQLIYTPYYQANNTLSVDYKNISFTTNIQYVGYQFTRSDNQDWINPYTLINQEIQYSIKQKKYDLVLSGRINNILNSNYEVRQWYPMPKMNYETTIKLIIK